MPTQPIKNAGAVFLDRDGTLIEKVNYLSRPDQIDLYPFSGRAVRTLNQSGLLTVLVTNQSGVGRGVFSEDDLAEIHSELQLSLASQGAHLDKIYYCPHHPEAKIPRYRQICGCRKPAPGMLRQAASELEIDLSCSYMIGDRLLDLEAGLQAGCQPILVLTGYGSNVVSQLNQTPFQGPGKKLLVSENLWEAVQSILETP